VDTIKEKILLTYDIRGIFPKDINADVAWRLGYFLPRFLNSTKKKLKIIIGRDSKPSGLVLVKNLSQGLIQNNVEVVDAGIITTPMLYYLIKNKKFDLGIIITGSHLGKNYTGFKIYNYNLEAITGESIKKNLNFFNRPITIGLNKGRVIRKNFITDYVNFLLQKTSIKNIIFKIQNKKILVCCPKSTQLILEKIKKELRLNIQFIHRPISKRLIQNRKNDLMVQFDNDGDRIYLFDKTGELILGDIVGIFLLETVKNQKPKKIILDCRSCEVLAERAKKYGFQVYFSPAGHSYFKYAMRKYNAILGIEKSGHYYWKTFFFADSGLFSFLMLLKFFAQQKESLENLVKKHHSKTIVLPEINFRLKKSEHRELIFKTIEKYFEKRGKISKIDGLTVWGKDFHFNLRFSQTEPMILRLNIEARDEKILNEILDLIKKTIKQS
jgi:phosphomannomutase